MKNLDSDTKYIMLDLLDLKLSSSGSGQALAQALSGSLRLSQALTL